MCFLTGLFSWSGFVGLLFSVDIDYGLHILNIYSRPWLGRIAR